MGRTRRLIGPSNLFMIGNQMANMYDMPKYEALDYCWCRDFGHKQTIEFLGDNGHEVSVEEIEQHRRTRNEEMRQFFINERRKHG